VSARTARRPGTTSSTVGRGVPPSRRAAPNEVPVECPPVEAGYAGEVRLFATALGEACASHASPPWTGSHRGAGPDAIQRRHVDKAGTALVTS